MLEAWYNHGYALSELGRHEDAIVSYDAAIRQRPAYADAWYNQGVALAALGRDPKKRSPRTTR